MKYFNVIKENPEIIIFLLQINFPKFRRSYNKIYVIGGNPGYGYSNII